MSGVTQGRGMNITDTLLTGYADSQIGNNDLTIHDKIFPNPTMTDKYNFDLIKVDEGQKLDRIEQVERNADEEAFVYNLEYSKTGVISRKIKIKFNLDEDIINDAQPQLIDNHKRNLVEAGYAKIALKREKDFSDLVFTSGVFNNNYTLGSGTQFDDDTVDWMDRLAQEILLQIKLGKKAPNTAIWGIEAWQQASKNTIVRDVLRQNADRVPDVNRIEGLLKARLPEQLTFKFNNFVGAMPYNSENNNNTKNKAWLFGKKLWIGYIEPNQSLTDQNPQKSTAVNYFVNKKIGNIRVRSYKPEHLDIEQVEMKTVYQFCAVNKDLGSLFNAVVS